MMQEVRERRVRAVEVPEIRAPESSPDSVQAAGHPGIIAEELFALSIDLPAGGAEPRHGVAWRLPALLNVHLLAD